MAEQIAVTLTKTRYEQPLVIVRESPLNGLDAEISPGQLRRLAAALILIAEEAEAHSVDMPAMKRSYPL